jgi:hypothetical protein
VKGICGRTASLIIYSDAIQYQANVEKSFKTKQMQEMNVAKVSLLTFDSSGIGTDLTELSETRTGSREVRARLPADQLVYRQCLYRAGPRAGKAAEATGQGQLLCRGQREGVSSSGQDVGGNYTEMGARMERVLRSCAGSGGGEA